VINYCYQSENRQSYPNKGCAVAYVSSQLLQVHPKIPPVEFVGDRVVMGKVCLWLCQLLMPVILLICHQGMYSRPMWGCSTKEL